jgi:excisionase family DNA binding protein
MNEVPENDGRPTFYTVQEAARIMRCNPRTLYRAIREDAFPAVRVRTRYVVPAAAVEKLAVEAAETGGCVDVARMAADRRTARDVARLTGGAPW